MIKLLQRLQELCRWHQSNAGQEGDADREQQRHPQEGRRVAVQPWAPGGLQRVPENYAGRENENCWIGQFTSHHFIIQEETTVQHQKEKEQRKLNAMGDENFIPTKNVAGPPVFYPQGNERIFAAY